MDSYTYEQAVEYLLSIPSFSGKNSFENTKDFISSLGRYEKMKNVIHVAGTNGKGSVCSVCPVSSSKGRIQCGDVYISTPCINK